MVFVLGQEVADLHHVTLPNIGAGTDKARFFARALSANRS
jgi:hypothetical protein